MALRASQQKGLSDAAAKHYAAWRTPESRKAWQADYESKISRLDARPIGTSAGHDRAARLFEAAAKSAPDARHASTMSAMADKHRDMSVAVERALSEKESLGWAKSRYSKYQEAASKARAASERASESPSKDTHQAAVFAHRQAAALATPDDAAEHRRIAEAHKAAHSRADQPRDDHGRFA